MPCYECGGQYQNGGHYNLDGDWVKSKGSGTFSGNAYYQYGGSNVNFKNRKSLESGVVVDKRSNKAYIVDDGRIARSFPVLTGKNPEGSENAWSVSEIEGREDRKVTPTGTFLGTMNPNIYGAPGFNLKPIQAFGEAAPKARAIAVHTTYDPAVRDKYYGMSPQDRYVSYGCINCKNPDVRDLTQRFPKGDTIMVLDPSKNRADAEYLQRLKKGIRKDGGDISTDEYIDNTLNSNQMNPLYNFIKRAQMGGEQQSQNEQMMQLVQAYAQMQGVDPQQIIAQLQQMTGPEQQQAVQQMMEAVQNQNQETTNFTNPMMAYGGEMGGPVMLPALPTDVYGMPVYGGGGAYLNPYTDAMMEMQDGGKPEWLIRAQLKAQGYSGSALENKLAQMRQGGIHINPANKGKFTAKAKAAGMGVQAYASKVLSAPEGKYSPATRKQANFAKNASKWKKQLGGLAEGSVLNNVDQDTLDELTRLGYQFEIM